MKKKLLAILTAALMLLGCLPVFAGEDMIPVWEDFSDSEFMEWLMSEEDMEKDAYLTALIADMESEEYLAFKERIEAITDDMMRESVLAYITAFIEATEDEPEPEPTEEPTPEPTEEPTPEPTEEPTPEPTEEPTPEPTEEPTPEPTEEPTPEPTEEPTPEPTEEPTPEPTEEPTPEPTAVPTEAPTKAPDPTEEPTPAPTAEPTPEPQADVTIMAPAELPAGQTVALSVIIKDGVKFGTPVWSIVKKSGVKGASITENGVLTTQANSTGTLTVRVTSSRNSSLYTDMTITVRKASSFHVVG